MDYQQELKKIQEGSNYWKPKPGQFKVKALSELEETDPYIKDMKKKYFFKTVTAWWSDNI